MAHEYSITDFVEDLYEFHNKFTKSCCCRRDLKLFKELFEEHFKEYPEPKKEENIINGT